MSRPPNPPRADDSKALMLLSQLCARVSQGQPIEKALEPLFARVNILFCQCLSQATLQPSHTEAVKAPADTAFLEKYVREYEGGKTPANDERNRKKYQLWVAVEKGELWHKLEQRWGRGIFLMASSLEGIEDK